MKRGMQREVRDRHRAAIVRKYEKIEMLRALIEMHEKSQCPDHMYIRDLYRKLRSVQVQLEAMNPL